MQHSSQQHQLPLSVIRASDGLAYNQWALTGPDLGLLASTTSLTFSVQLSAWLPSLIWPTACACVGPEREAIYIVSRGRDYI